MNGLTNSSEAEKLLITSEEVKVPKLTSPEVTEGQMTSREVDELQMTSPEVATSELMSDRSELDPVTEEEPSSDGNPSPVFKTERHVGVTGLERFRHAARMIVLMLRAVGLKPDKPKEEHYNFLSWTIMYDEVLGISRLNYDSGNLTFDPLAYKANKESTITEEVKEILRLPPEQRTDNQVHIVLMCFQHVVPSFSEFPIRIQKSMIKVCTYEKFEAGRAIIRQGHRAENFYFIISGCAVVTEMDSEANHAVTTNVLGKGNSFGELAFLNMSKRSATVTCRDTVELICIEREDFIDIFMRQVKGKEPDHITFLKTVELLKHWPVAMLPHDNPKICAFTYVRRGVILCHDSSRSDWIVVLVSGTCKILKALHDTPARSYSTPDIKLSSTLACPKIYTRSATCGNLHHGLRESQRHQQQQQQHQHQQKHQQHKRSRKQGTAHPGNSVHLLPTLNKEGKENEIHVTQTEHLAHINNIYYKKHILPSILDNKSKYEDSKEKSSRKISPQRLELRPPVSYLRPKRQSYGLQPPALPQIVTPQVVVPAQAENSQPQSDVCNKVFIEITRLVPGDVFGMEHVVLLGMRDVTSYSLVSEGAEVVLISKKFFKKHLTEETTKKIREMIRPLPSEKTLQRNLNTQRSWDAFKAETVARHSHERHRIRTSLKT